MRNQNTQKYCRNTSRPQAATPTDTSSPMDQTETVSFTVDFAHRAFSEVELNDLLPDLNLPKESAEMLHHVCLTKIFWQKTPVKPVLGIGMTNS